MPCDEDKVRNLFAKRFMNGLTTPRTCAIIAVIENKPLGWVNRYVEKRFPDSWLVGIDICEDEYLNRGIGTEALRLWVDYLFANSDIHRIGFATYSFNPRMRRVAQKLGFTYEGTDREIIRWQNKWVDRLHFGILRQEWEQTGER
jgi:RimJ/RimL family protein N-acetyltransferase